MGSRNTMVHFANDIQQTPHGSQGRWRDVFYELFWNIYFERRPSEIALSAPLCEFKVWSI